MGFNIPRGGTSSAIDFASIAAFSCLTRSSSALPRLSTSFIASVYASLNLATKASRRSRIFLFSSSTGSVGDNIVGAERGAGGGGGRLNGTSVTTRSSSSGTSYSHLPLLFSSVAAGKLISRFLGGVYADQRPQRHWVARPLARPVPRDRLSWPETVALRHPSILEAELGDA